MNHRGRDIDTLFRRLPKAVVAPDPVTAIDAARAVDEWPLLAMLTQPVSATAREPHHMMMPVADVPSSNAMSAAAASLSQPALELQPEMEASGEDVGLSPLEQLFRRAERTGKTQTSQPSVFAPLEPSPGPLTAPPPLKVPAQRGAAGATRPVAATSRAAPATDGGMTIVPRATEWHAPGMAPEKLFERVGGR